MVTESQVREADPLVKQIDSIEVLLQQINTGAAAGDWKSNYIVFHDSGGQTQQLNISALPAASILDSLFQLAQTTKAQLETELAGI